MFIVDDTSSYETSTSTSVCRNHGTTPCYPRSGSILISTTSVLLVLRPTLRLKLFKDMQLLSASSVSTATISRSRSYTSSSALIFPTLKCVGPSPLYQRHSPTCPSASKDFDFILIHSPGFRGTFWCGALDQFKISITSFNDAHGRGPSTLPSIIWICHSQDVVRHAQLGHDSSWIGGRSGYVDVRSTLGVS